MLKVFFDFEVFKFDWCVTFVDYDTRAVTAIVNDRQSLQAFYDAHKDDIFCGYNSRNYDMVIFKGILQGLDPWEVNYALIEEEKKGFQILKRGHDIPINNFDLMQKDKSLKQLEGFMGSKIKESSIDFRIGRKLTEAEMKETLEYNLHDVLETIKVFDQSKEEFESQLSLIEAFQLPMSDFNRTKAQLSAKILGANRVGNRSDEFEITFPEPLQLSEKTQPVADWYLDPRNRNYKRFLVTDLFGVRHFYGWGGVHAAIPNYTAEGIIMSCDVASLYPAMMINYGFLSRAVENPKLYRQIRDTRLELKRKRDKKQAPYKIVLNSTFGASKDEQNPLFDPLNANRTCIGGQLLLLDLEEKIAPFCQIIQVNTDGIFMKCENYDVVEKIKAIAKEWEVRTGLDLEWDEYCRIVQKDVNNYLVADKDGHVKSKGAYIKKLSNIDYDLAIVNKALVDYFMLDIPIRDTILGCNKLRDFQKIIKVSRLFSHALHGDTILKERVLRVFASKDENAPPVRKVKGADDAPQKVGYLSEHTFINNDDVTEALCPEELDYEYYIAMAESRLADFLNPRSSSSKKVMSEIKSVSADVKAAIDEIDLDEFDTFTEFLVHIVENSICNKTAIKNMTSVGCFEKFGGNRKLLYLISEFYDTSNKYSKTVKQETKLKKVRALEEIERLIPDTSLPIGEQLQVEMDILGFWQLGFDCPKQYAYVTDVNTDFSPRVTLYCLSNDSWDKLKTIKIPKFVFGNTPLKVGDIVHCSAFDKRPKSRINPDKDSKQKFLKDWDNLEYWLVGYHVVSDFAKELELLSA